jgi:hypothetical protein
MRDSSALLLPVSRRDAIDARAGREHSHRPVDSRSGQSRPVSAPTRPPQVERRGWSTGPWTGRGPARSRADRAVPDSSLELGSLPLAWRVLVGSNHANAHRRVELNSRTPARGAQWWARGWPRRAGCDNDVVPSRMSWAPFRRIGGDNVAGQTDEALEGRQFDLFSTCRVAGKGPDRPVTDLAAADRHRPALPTRPTGVGGQVAGSRSVRSAR